MRPLLILLLTLLALLADPACASKPAETLRSPEYAALMREYPVRVRGDLHPGDLVVLGLSGGTYDRVCVAPEWIGPEAPAPTDAPGLSIDAETTRSISADLRLGLGPVALHGGASSEGTGTVTVRSLRYLEYPQRALRLDDASQADPDCRRRVARIQRGCAAAYPGPRAVHAVSRVMVADIVESTTAASRAEGGLGLDVPGPVSVETAARYYQGGHEHVESHGLAWSFAAVPLEPVSRVREPDPCTSRLPAPPAP